MWKRTKTYCHSDEKNACNDKINTFSGKGYIVQCKCIKFTSCLEKRGKKFTEYANTPKILKLSFHPGCQASGVYGDTCKELCPTNCRDNVCHIQKGTCYGCAPGWTYTSCNTSRITLTFKLIFLSSIFVIFVIMFFY